MSTCTVWNFKMFTTSCFDIWRQEAELCKIITFCKDLDVQLGGGISSQMVTELCGPPGSGKTQICLQLSINVQLPKEFGGVGGRALYVDTNQGFNPERLKEISIDMGEHFQTICSQSNNNSIFNENFAAFNTTSILENISYIYCADYVELLATVECIRMTLTKMPELKLVIIDSFSFPLRSIDDVSSRSSINYNILRDLQQMAVEFQIAVVITNELTTRIFDSNSKIFPALGESHFHKINQRILLSRNHGANHHVAFIEKSLLSPRVAVPFMIKQGGIRGIS